MFELWLITAGDGAGELILTDATPRADIPAPLWRRIVKVGPRLFATRDEASAYRREYAEATPIVVARHDRN